MVWLLELPVPAREPLAVQLPVLEPALVLELPVALLLVLAL